MPARKIEPSKRKPRLSSAAKWQLGLGLLNLGTGVGTIAHEHRVGKGISDAQHADFVRRLKEQLPHAKDVDTTRWRFGIDGSSPHYQPEIPGDQPAAVRANSAEALSHELSHADLYRRLGSKEAPAALGRGLAMHVGPLTGLGLAAFADPHGRLAKKHWIPSVLGMLPTLADEGQANVRGYLAAHRAGLKPSVWPYLGGMASYLTAAALPVLAGHALLKKRQHALAKKKSDERKLQKHAELPPSAVKERGALPFGIDLAKLEQHANEHRLMALLGIDHRGRPRVSPATPGR